MGRRTGFRGQLGIGAPPIPGLGTLDKRGGFVGHGMFPITQTIHFGAFGMVEVDEYSKFRGFNWTAGAAIRVMLETQD